MVTHTRCMERWTSGYTHAELESAQERHALRFPPDLIDLLLDRQPINGPDWRGDDHLIRRMLAWPMDRLTSDVEHGSWWRDWGDRPLTAEDRRAVVADALAKAPTLIPLYSHRFIPETPSVSGNPVFSMYGLDTIYYGSNLDNYFAREFGKNRELEVGEITIWIPFWSDLAEDI